jgi:hypothetical protein
MAKNNNEEIKKDLPKDNEEMKSSVLTPTIPYVYEKHETGGDTVSVDKSLIEAILRKQEDLEKKISDRDEQIKQLQYAADKARMGIWDSRNTKSELIRTYGVGIWVTRDEKTGEPVENIIRGSKIILDDVIIEEHGGIRRVVEHQIIRLFLDQGLDENGKEKPFKELDMDYVNFWRSIQRKRFPVVRESKSDIGEFRTLRLDDGREVEFDIRFLNY